MYLFIMMMMNLYSHGALSLSLWQKTDGNL